MKVFGIVIFAVSALALPALAQSDARREACLSQAAAQGLYSPPGQGRGRGVGQANNATAPQRAAFMKRCMKGK